MTPDQHQALVDELIRDEGVRAKPYMDTVGKVTIGCGRNLTDVGLSQAEIMVLLENDIHRAVVEAETFGWFGGLDETRQRVILNMLFNLGKSRFSLFKDTIHAIAVQNYEQAAQHMLASAWAHQVGKRADRLAEMMRTGHG